MIFRLYSGLLYVWRVRVWLPTIVQINTIGLFKYYNLYNVSRVTRVDIKWYTVKRVDGVIHGYTPMIRDRESGEGCNFENYFDVLPEIMLIIRIAKKKGTRMLSRKIICNSYK